MMASAQQLEDGMSIVIHGMNQSFAANNGVQMAGQTAYAEASRWSFLIGKDQMSSVQALGFRTATEAGSGAERRLPTTVPAAK